MNLPRPVELLIGVIFSDTRLLEPSESELKRSFGKIELRSPIYEFDATDYYRGEMGQGLRRIFYSFEELISPERIADVKVLTCEIEHRFAEGGKRRVNIDPGYIDFYKLVLASAKFMGQKIYLGKGVYADPTLYYDKGWKSFDWGFPDFKDGRYNDFLTDVRRIYRTKIRGLRQAGPVQSGGGSHIDDQDG